MSNVILHISDLHVSTFRFSDGRANSKVNSYLTTDSETGGSDHYIKKFTDQIKADFPGYEYILIITGDIADKADKPEYTFAKRFITAIINDLAIEAAKVLLLPGDHDVHRRSLENELDDKPNTQSHRLNEIKFANFSAFYKEIKTKDFLFDKLIVDHLVIDNKIILIGVNSNYKINIGGGEGFLPIDAFSKELEEVRAKFGSEGFQYVICWHHNITAGYEDTNSGQWENENRQHLLAELERQNIKLVLTGNEHTNHAKSVLLNSIWTSDAGAFSSKNSYATFKAYPVIIDQKVTLQNLSYGLQTPQGNDQAYFWNKLDNSSAKQPNDFILYLENTQIITEVTDLPHPALEEEQVLPIIPTTVLPLVRTFYDNPAISDKLYAIIKEKQLFHSGHFHWSQTSRAHNWIDVSKLLEEHGTLYFVQNAIIDMIDKFDLAENSDLIIGLGYEGNIISSKAAIRYNIPYSSLPYSYRYEDHHDYENKLNYDNSEGKYKTVIIITDVVNDGRTIRKLIDEREGVFFQKVEKIIVLSLFYTGHEEINNDILNYDNLPKTYDLENDYKVNKIEYYTIKSLRVEKCPYGNNYKEECFIYKDGLSCVHTFYAE